jgi:peptide/nickel transport system permease protein
VSSGTQRPPVSTATDVGLPQPPHVSSPTDVGLPLPPHVSNPTGVGLPPPRPVSTPSTQTFAALIFGALVIAALILGSLMLGHRPSAIDLTQASAPPSATFWLGTDALGRDILARTVVAAPLSIALALVAVATAFAIGVPLGGVTGIGPLWLRDGAARLIHILLSFPSMLAALVVVTMLGPGGTNAAVALGLAMAPGFARVTQTLTVAVAGSDYMAAAKALGVPPLRRFTHYLLPNIAGPLAVKSAAEAGSALVIIASFSFLGFGVQAPDYDWGRMLAQGLRALYTTPLAALVPGVAITATGLAFNLISGRLLTPARASRRIRAARPTAPSPALGPSQTQNPSQPTPSSAATGPAVEPPASPTHPPALCVRGLTVHYGENAAVEDVGFDIAAGETVGLVGESGSGKTTLAMALAGLTSGARVQSHSLEIAGSPLSELGSRELAALYGLRVGLVFQDALSAFNPLLNVGRQIAERLEVHESATRRAAAQSTLEIMAEVGIDAPPLRAHQRPRQLSGGLRQRALIAMGLVTRPMLLIADEPTTALDVTVQAKVLTAMREAARERDTAILFVSHDLAVVAELCDRVLVLYAGRIVEILSWQTLANGGARHPYTRALVGCLPSGVSGSRLTAIPAAAAAQTAPDSPSAPSPKSTPGCRFAPRCTLATAICLTKTPVLAATPNGDAVACWAIEVAK